VNPLFVRLYHSQASISILFFFTIRKMIWPMRIDALLSRFGYCSRREAAAWVKKSRVQIKGLAATSVSQKADPKDVTVDGEPIEFPDGLYVAFNKPTGVVCSHSDEEGERIYDLLPPLWLSRNPEITTVGRLDRATEGLIFLTDDGQWLHRLTSPKHHVAKTYHLTTSAPIPQTAVELFESGSLVLEGEKTPCLPAKLTLISDQEAEITLEEGRYHQVRRMLAAVGAPVETLKRTAIGKIQLSDLGLNLGEWIAIDPSSV
jgi:16S rRNA pseudouridine516 synthase